MNPSPVNLDWQLWGKRRAAVGNMLGVTTWPHRRNALGLSRDCMSEGITLL